MSTTINSLIAKPSKQLYNVYVEYCQHGEWKSLEHTVQAATPRDAYYVAIEHEEYLLKHRINTTTFERCRGKRIINVKYGVACK